MAVTGQAPLGEPHHGGAALLVLAARGPHAGLRVPAALLGLTGEAPNEYGGGPPLRPDADGVVSPPGDGPAFQVWQLA